MKIVGTALMYHAPSISRTLSVALLVPLMVLENAMGCKVFRDIKLDIAARNGSFSNIPSKPMQFVRGGLPSDSCTRTMQ